MDQVERGFRQRLTEEIVASDLDTVVRKRLEEADVEIDCQHRAGVAHALREQPGGRAGTGPYVKATPAIVHTYSLELPNRVWIKKLLEERKPRPL